MHSTKIEDKSKTQKAFLLLLYANFSRKIPKAFPFYPFKNYQNVFTGSNSALFCQRTGRWPGIIFCSFVVILLFIRVRIGISKNEFKSKLISTITHFFNFASVSSAIVLNFLINRLTPLILEVATTIQTESWHFYCRRC